MRFRAEYVLAEERTRHEPGGWEHRAATYRHLSTSTVGEGVMFDPPLVVEVPLSADEVAPRSIRMTLEEIRHADT